MFDTCLSERRLVGRVPWPDPNVAIAIQTHNRPERGIFSCRANTMANSTAVPGQPGVSRAKVTWTGKNPRLGSSIYKNAAPQGQRQQRNPGEGERVTATRWARRTAVRSYPSASRTGSAHTAHPFLDTAMQDIQHRHADHRCSGYNSSGRGIPRADLLRTRAMTWPCSSRMPWMPN